MDMHGYVTLVRLGVRVAATASSESESAGKFETNPSG